MQPPSLLSPWSGAAWRIVRATGQDVLHLAMAGACGWLALNTVPAALALLVLAPMFWASARNRWWAGAAMAAWVMGAGWSVVPAIPVYFGEQASLWLALAALAVVGFINATPWTLLWARKGRGWRLLVVLVLITAPPFGWFGWASPLNAAGFIAPPGSGWLGLLFTVGLLLVAVRSEWMARAWIAATLVVLAMAIALGWDPDGPQATDVAGIDLELPALPMTHAAALVERQRVLRAATEEVRETTWVLPEAIAGEWSFAEPMWDLLSEKQKAAGRGGWVGAMLHEDSESFHNVMVGVGIFQGQVYRQRYPIPWAMWRPFSAQGARAQPLAPSVLDTPAGRLGFLVCYEQLIVAPILQTLFEGPERILAPSNAWWAATPQIPAMQRTTMRAWSRLFAVPIVTAINEPPKS